MNEFTAAEPPVSVLRLDVVADDDEPTVALTVDGVPLLQRELREFRGWHPRELFSPELPLLPAENSRRVSVATCSCGVPGCGTAAPVIDRRGNVVSWSDFQDFTGVYTEPLAEEPLPLGGTSIGVSDFRFDRAQYEAEVLRLAADRSWETPLAATARLLRSMLQTDGAVMRAHGYRVGWVSPTADRGEHVLTLSLDRRNENRRGDEPDHDRAFEPPDVTGLVDRARTSGRTSGFFAIAWEPEWFQELVGLPVTHDTPAGAAASLYERLQTVPIDRWSTEFPARLG